MPDDCCLAENVGDGCCVPLVRASRRYRRINLSRGLRTRTLPFHRSCAFPKFYGISPLPCRLATWTSNFYFSCSICYFWLFHSSFLFSEMCTIEFNLWKVLFQSSMVSSLSLVLETRSERWVNTSRVGSNLQFSFLTKFIHFTFFLLILV